MIAPCVVIGCALAAAIVAGTIADRPRVGAPRRLGDYHVLAADFHVHAFPQSWSTLSPWDAVIEARHQGLDVLGITPHDQIWTARVGQWFARAFGGPIVIVGEEITTDGYHLLGIGLTRAVSGDLPLGAAIDDVHAQGGVAIAAHPYRSYWPAYDREALRALDAAEVVRPEAQHDERLAAELREFFGRASLSAIGDSAYHGIGPIGYSRTYVFARTRDEAGVDGGLPHEVPELPPPGSCC